MARAICCLLLLAGCMASESVQVYQEDFDSTSSGELPPEFAVSSGDWLVMQDPGAPSGRHVVGQTSQRYSHSFVAVHAEVPADVRVEVTARIVGGVDEREAGLMVRYTSPIDHYVFNIDANEGGVRFTRVASGIRDDLVLDRDVPFTPGTWYELRLDVRGDRFTGYVDGDLVLDIRDGTHGTGGVGLWSKKDSLARFDDLRVWA